MVFKKDNGILKTVFSIDNNIKLNNDEKEYLEDLKEELVDLIAEEGEVGIPKIREVILDDLLKNDYINLMKYLSIDVSENVEETLETRITDPNFIKVEESENKDDFFNRYLDDGTINDLIMSLRGYDRRSEGSKEVFIKKRGCLIPSKRIDAISRILTSLFNKTSFLSEKEDVEQARIIMLSYSQIFDILLEIPYECCDTQRTIEILSMVVVKLSNMIGISKGFRKELMETLKDSYKSLENKKGGVETFEND